MRCIVTHFYVLCILQYFAQKNVLLRKGMVIKGMHRVGGGGGGGGGVDETTRVLW